MPFSAVLAQACSHITQVRRDELALLEHVLKSCQRDDAAVTADRCVTCPSLPHAQVNRDQLALLEFVLKSCYREDSALMGRRYICGWQFLLAFMASNQAWLCLAELWAERMQ